MKKLFFTLFIAALGLMTACNDEEVSPNIITASNFESSIDENAQKGNVIGKFTASTSRGVITYSITSQSVDNAIAIDANTGTITVADESAFDYETNTSITGKIKVTTEDATEKEVDFTININNLSPDINITVNKGSGPQNIANGATFDYGFVGGGTGYTFKIQNLGEDELSLTGNPLVKVSGEAYSLSIPPGGNKIPVGGETSFIVNFSPTSFGTVYTGTIEIANDDTDESLYIINLTGEEAP